jgi:4-amino-4-deoxy-L-arabinose transferase-like glycosyltransferase
VSGYRDYDLENWAWWDSSWSYKREIDFNSGVGHNRQLAGQISWFLPFSLLSLVVIIWQTKFRFPLGKVHQFAFFWGTWLIPQVVFFSFAGLFHRYYLEMLAPAIAALSGAGFVCMVSDYKKPGWKGWMLPIGFLLLGLTETYILASFPDYAAWLIPIVLGVSVLVSLSLFLLRFSKGNHNRTRNGLVVAGLVITLLPLWVWAFIPVWSGGRFAV